MKILYRFKYKFLSLFVLFAIVMHVSAESHHGHFKGELLVQFLENETNVVVKSPITYIDPDGDEWPVPVEFKTDGASVPRFAWVAFPPFAGRYIRAAVVHDYYCFTRDRPWREVHRAFFDAMLAAGVDSTSAKTMYAAVYTFGPRWSLAGADRSISLSPITQEDQATANVNLTNWIEEENPSLEEIDLYVNRERIRQVPPAR